MFFETLVVFTKGAKQSIYLLLKFRNMDSNKQTSGGVLRE